MGALDNQKMFARFGWVEPGGNPFDSLPGIAGKEASRTTPPNMRLSRKRLWESLKAQGMDGSEPGTLSPYAQAVLQSLPLTEASSLSAAEEAKAASQIRMALQEAQQIDCKTSVEVCSVLLYCMTLLTMSE